MKYIFITLFFIAFPLLSHADLSDCKNLYVGRISVNADGLQRAVFLTDPKNTSGSYWVYFTNFGEQGKNSALSLLTAAKLSGHRIDIYTSETDSCSISTGPKQAVSMDLSNFK